MSRHQDMTAKLNDSQTCGAADLSTVTTCLQCVAGVAIQLVVKRLGSRERRSCDVHRLSPEYHDGDAYLGMSTQKAPLV